MSHTVESLAKLVGGEVRGDGGRVIVDANAIEMAGPHAVTFVVDQSHVSRLKECQAGAVILNAKVAAILSESPSCALIVVPDPQVAFVQILPLFRKVRPRPERGVSPRANIAPSAKLGRDCFVGPSVCIGEEVEIGDGCDLHPGVVIGAGVQAR